MQVRYKRANIGRERVFFKREKLFEIACVCGERFVCKVLGRAQKVDEVRYVVHWFSSVKSCLAKYIKNISEIIEKSAKSNEIAAAIFAI